MGWPVRLVSVRGPSMVPTVRDADRLLVWLRRPRSTPSIGRVVLVALPDRPLSVKRLVAAEPDGRIRVEGDNPFGSTDSRSLGALPADAVRGLVLLRVWPRPGPLPRRPPT
jgi:signal peptidase I